MMKYFYSLAVLSLLLGCADTEHTSQTPLPGTTWNLVEMNTKKIQLPGPQVPHLHFEAEKVTGNDGCNNFFGGYTLDENNLTFGMLASTRMACPQIEGFDIEFNEVISMTTRYRISGNKLELFGKDKLLASFLAAQKS
jgi:heat shock protein HslJ